MPERELYCVLEISLFSSPQMIFRLLLEWKNGKALYAFGFINSTIISLAPALRQIINIHLKHLRITSMMLSDLRNEKGEAKGAKAQKKRIVEVKLIHANGKSFYASSGTAWEAQK